MLEDPSQMSSFHIHRAACLKYLELRCVQKVTIHMKEDRAGIKIHEVKAAK